jgi:peptide/nickel transport system substrate-binding protein
MKRRILLSTLPAAALMVAACGPQSTGGQPAGGEQPAAGKPVKGGTLTAAMARDAANFDPTRQSDVYSASVMNVVIDTLYEIDKDAKVVGRLVEKTENPSPNVYVMTMRKGIKFHDGTDFNAEAVRFNLQRHLDDPRSVRLQDVQSITSLEVTDPYTLKVTLKEAYAPFLNKLTAGAGYVLSPAAVQKLGEALQRDLTGAGSGPYKFTQWQKDTQVVVDRNPSYWKKDAAGEALPYLDKIVFKPFPDENVRLTNVKTGDADLLIANPPYKDIASLKSDSALDVKQIPGIGWQFMFVNTQSEPFSSVPLRRAFNLAIDREQISKTVTFGNAEATDTPVMKIFPWATVTGPHPYMKRDVAKAKSELQAAGKGSTVKFTLQISNASPELLQVAELIKDQIKEVGLDMEIQPIEFATVVANGQSGAYQALCLGWSGDTDPDTLYSLFPTGAGFNFAKYSNPEVDKLLNEGRTNLEQSKRGDAYKAVQQVLWQDSPMLPLYNTPQISTTRKVVQNYPQTYNGYWGTRDYERVWKTGAR